MMMNVMSVSVISLVKEHHSLSSDTLLDQGRISSLLLHRMTCCGIK